ncbi:MAG: UDP-N-acetylmuramoyl-tripeptide--D-alanyl-D-alanine ligase [Pseudomonadota bacterium]
MIDQAVDAERVVNFVGQYPVAFDPGHVRSGAVYFALVLPGFDGHEHVASAVRAGARAIVINAERARGAREQLQKEGLITHILAVSTSLSAFRSVARARFVQRSIDAIVVAGSVGKTTTRRLLGEMLKSTLGPILETKGNQNGFFGVAATALSLRPEHRIAVFEVGIDTTNAMAKHLDLIGHESAILTAIGHEHLNGLNNIETVFAEQRLVIDMAAGAKGVMVLNLDDPLLASLAQEIADHRSVIGYTLRKEVPIYHSRIDLLRGSYSPNDNQLLVNGLGMRELSLPLPLPGAHNASNILGAFSLARFYGVTGDDAQKALTTFVAVPGRSEVKTLRSGARLICDCYNANPLSTQAAIQMLDETAKNDLGLRWACLGDMLDLGEEAHDLHRQLAPFLVEARVDHVLLFGEAMAHLADELKTINFSGRVAHFDSIHDLTEDLASGVAFRSSRDTVLIKGSRGMNMGRIESFLIDSNLA